jgi:murein DD-endopeptidase MepM/ murein hydrolase activator NlpD
LTSLASVFVEVRPDTSHFSTELKQSLARTREAVDVATNLDTAKLKPQLDRLKADLKSITVTKATITADSAKASAQIKALRAEMRGLSENVKINADDSQAVERIAEIKTELATLGDAKSKLTVDSSLASAHVKALQAQLQVFDGTTATADVKVRGTDGVNFAFRGVSNLTTAIVGLAPIAVPALAAVTAGVGVLGGALLAAGGAGAIWGGVLAGALTKYKKDVETLKSLGKQLASATDPAKVAAIKEQMTAITDQWSPAEKEFDRLAEKFGQAFQALVKAAGPATFGVLNTGMAGLIGLMPRLAPLINSTGRAIGGLVADLVDFTRTRRFQSILDFFLVYGPSAITHFGHIAGNILLGVFNLFAGFAPQGANFLRTFEEMTASFERWSAGFSRSGGFQRFMAYAQRVLPDVRDLFLNLTEFVGKFIVALGPLAGVELRVLTLFLAGLNSLPPAALTAIAVGITGLVLALKAWELGSKAVAVAEGISTVRTWLFVGATNAETGAVNLSRVAMLRARVATIASAVAAGVAATATTVWAAATVALDAALAVLTSPITLVIVGVAALAAGLIYAYKHSDRFHHIVVAAWQAVKDSAVAVVHWFTRSFVPFFTDTIPNAFRATVNWVRRNWPVILAILTGPVGLATLFITRHWDQITNAFRTGRDWVMGAFRRSWDRVQAVFTSPVQAAVRVFRNLFGAGGTVRTLFRDAVSAIGGIWRGIQGAMSGPVNWVIRNVINRLVDAVNWVSRKLNKGNILQHFGRVGGGGGGGGIASNPGRGALNPGFARGGVLPGYTPGKDVHTFHSATGGTLHLSGGEAVMRPEWTRAVGGAPAVQRMNDAARRGMRFAGGGVVWPTVGRRISTYRGHDGVDINQPPGPNFGAPIYAYRAGRITYTGWGRGYGDAVFEKGNVGPEVVYGHMSRVVARAGQAVRAGQTIGYVGATGHAFGPHLHFGVPGGTYAGALSLLRGATNVPGGSSGALGALQDLFDPLAAITRRLRGLGRGAIPGGEVGRGLVGAVRDKVTDLATGWARGLVGTVGSAAGAVIGGNGAKAYAQKALANYGWGMAQWPALNALWEKESGWNPRADNPTSSAYGIPQALPGSKMASAGRDWRTNAATQIRWGLGYIRDIYGRPTNAWAHSQSHNWYDDGGVARGRGVILKNTAAPERVLSPRQTDTYDRLLPILERLDAGGRGPVRIVLDAGGGVTLTGHIDNRIQGRQAQSATISRQRR